MSPRFYCREHRWAADRWKASIQVVSRPFVPSQQAKNSDESLHSKPDGQLPDSKSRPSPVLSWLGLVKHMESRSRGVTRAGHAGYMPMALHPHATRCTLSVRPRSLFWGLHPAEDTAVEFDPVFFPSFFLVFAHFFFPHSFFCKHRLGFLDPDSRVPDFAWSLPELVLNSGTHVRVVLREVPSPSVLCSKFFYLMARVSLKRFCRHANEHGLHQPTYLVVIPTR